MDIDFFRKTRIFDGGMGQELLARGMEPNGTLWSANALLDEQYHQLLLDTHLDFINAGAEIIVTATFTTRRLRLRDNNVEDQFEYLNTKAIVGELIRTAVGDLKSTNINKITNLDNLNPSDKVSPLSWSEVLDLPSVVLDSSKENYIRNGQLLENRYFKTSNKHLIIIDNQLKAVYEPFNEKYFKPISIIRSTINLSSFRLSLIHI